MGTLARLVSRKWWFATLLVLAGMAGLVKLGFWQLDRLEQRRAFNTMVAERWALEPFDLENEELPADLSQMEYRRVEAGGVFDYDRQIVVTNWPGPNGEAGVLVVTPRVFDNGKAVLVARGWVPQDLAAPEQWPGFEEPADQPVLGLIQESQTIEGATAPAEPQREWYRIDVPLIQQQMPYTLAPAFLLQLPEPGRQVDTFPSREIDIVLDEGSHLSYSIQWFTFAAVLGFGYILFVRSQDARARRQSEAAAASPGSAPESFSDFGGYEVDAAASDAHPAEPAPSTEQPLSGRA